MHLQCYNNIYITAAFTREPILRFLIKYHNHFMALILGPPGWSGARRKLLDFMAQGKINRGSRHTDHPAGRHSIRTNKCPPPPTPIFFTGRMPFLPPNEQLISNTGIKHPTEQLPLMIKRPNNVKESVLRKDYTECPTTTTSRLSYCYSDAATVQQLRLLINSFTHATWLSIWLTTT